MVINKALEDITVENYQPHWLHTSETLWPQSNCYVDLWVEMLHSLKLNPVACLAFTLATDFEGDQWTFFKVPLYDLFQLYGIDVQELQIWDSLPQHILTQTLRNRLVLVELDAFYLPDVGDTSYHQAHEKTTVGVQRIDLAAREMDYFHNRGLYTLHGADFERIFHIGEDPETLPLPPYVEFAKLDHLKKHSNTELANLASELLHAQFARRPALNPFIMYRQHFKNHVALLPEYTLEDFHKYAFATMRQYGASYEYAALFLKWLADYKGELLREAASAFVEISSSAQILLLKTARAVHSKKPFDFQAFLEPMEANWDKAMKCIASI
jgi:hypothetical protein